VLLAWRWVFQQYAIKERIDNLKEGLLKNTQKLTTYDSLGSRTARVEKEEYWSLIVGVVWVIVDLFSYWFIRNNLGLSKGYGAILNIWLLTELISWSTRIGFSLHVLAGLAVFVIGLILHWFILWIAERRFDRTKHQGSHFDNLCTSFFKNIFVMVIIYNIVMHTFAGTGITYTTLMAEGLQVLKRAKGSLNVMIFWGFNEFILLLNEYYYVLAILPQIMLNFKLRSVEKSTFVRIALLGLLSWSKWSCFCGNSISLALGLKEGTHLFI
jgi:hypothetical protein